MFEADLFSGRSIETISGAAVFAACRTSGIVRQAAEVASVARADEAQVWHCYQVLNVELGLAAALITPTAWVPRIASEVDLTATVQQRAFQYAPLVEAHEARFGGTAPSSLAATCVSLAIEKAEYEQDCDAVTQKAVADAAGVVPSTIRNHEEDLQALINEAAIAAPTEIPSSPGIGTSTD